LTLHQLRIFAAVAKYLNITKASEQLHITQPSVSQQLKFLEEECGVKLYKKMSRGIELTARGQRLLNDVEPLLLQVENLNEKFKDIPNDRKVGFFTIGGGHGPSAYFLPILLAAFKETHPQVQLTLRTNNSRAIEQMVLDSEVEIAMVVNPAPTLQLTMESCRQEELVIFASTKHMLAKRQKLSLAELARAPLIILKRKGAADKTWEILRQIENRGPNSRELRVPQSKLRRN